MAEPQRRKRVSQACVPCGIKRIKCDGAVPSCGQCRRKSEECAYGISKRNKRQKTAAPLPFLLPAAPTTLLEQDPNKFCASKEAENGDQRQERGSLTPSVQAQSSIKQPSPNTEIVTPAFSARLFKNYFLIVHPMWPILYKPMYDLVAYENLADALPKPLLYAIYSIAACVQLQPDQDVQTASQTEALTAVPGPEFLFETALSVLQQFGNEKTNYHPLNVLKPSIETCQTLTILALQQHGLAEFSSAALLCGMASAMAIELNLHRAMSSDSDPTQVQINSRLWWSIFVLDKMMACEMGRPVILRTEETNTPYPSTTESDEYQLLPVKSGAHHASSIKTQTLSGFHTSLRITIIMEMVSRQIYSMSARTMIRDDRLASEETRQRLWNELREYHRMLDNSPLKLDMDSSTVATPATITNMVWMWCTTILLHRPFISYSYEPRISGNEVPSTWVDPLEVCVAAANSTCSILEKYAENLAMMSCDIIFPIFTTASTLAHFSKQIGSEGIETQRRIDLCIRWLLILGKSWKSAEARQKVLTQNLGLSHKTSVLQTEDQEEAGQPRHASNDADTGTHYTNNMPLAIPATSNTPVQVQEPQALMEDWAFLRNLGNTTDELYTIDAEFREFLDKEYEVDDIYGLF